MENVSLSTPTVVGEDVVVRVAVLATTYRLPTPAPGAAGTQGVR
jgi:hypothetical protein